MNLSARPVRLLVAILRPWVIVLALLGAAVTAFPPWLGGAEPFISPHPAGPTVQVMALRWPHPRAICFGWAFREWPRRYLGWSEYADRFGVGRAEIGFDSSSPTPNVRPPGASADFVMYYVSLWWLLGAPAALSVLAGWRTLRREPKTLPADGRPSLAWPLARPWAATFGVVGVGLLVSGLNVPGSAGPHQTLFEMHIQRTPLEAWHPREAFAVLAQVRPPAAGGGVLSAKALTLGVWWLIAIPAACNFVTMARLARRRGTGRSV
ncbi:hypothetical protein [Alienimonas californiensis]|nr:hypothetical protein [Alienimonas californiensis]